ncbi:lipopolysaccharide assembly protein LapA domain-containing protein [Pseudaeromonas paramecii]|uniref:Probable lipopolysaccharide assembly protein A n=1 Tax=Pseudaeromonas paramecii TaxID=2138166 RepID=A0ABP8Q0B8_9GAMM
MRNLAIIFVVVVVCAIALTLGAENNQLVRVNFLIARGEFYLSTLLALVFLGGFAFASLVWSWGYFRQQFRQQKLQKQLQRQAKELNSLRGQLGKE